MKSQINEWWLIKICWYDDNNKMRMRHNVTRYKMKNWWCEIIVWNDDVILMFKMTMWNNVNLCHNDMM